MRQGGAHLDEDMKTYDQDHAVSVAVMGFFSKPSSRAVHCMQDIAHESICRKPPGGKYMVLCTADTGL